MIIKPMVRNGICMNAHPEGCRVQVRKQIEYVKNQGPIDGPKNVLVVGSSTGYGLAGRIVATFGCGANTVGLFYERPGSEKRSGTSGWYNTAAFDDAASREGYLASSINGDAFSDEIKEQTVSTIKESYGPIDLVVYSLAAPVRTDPETGETYRSVIKPIGEPFESKSCDPMTGEVQDLKVEPATEDEVEATVKVMGGEDWKRWIVHLSDAGVLAAGVKTVAFSYIGPPSTQGVYRDGTIGKAKEHLEKTAVELNRNLSESGGEAYVSVNKALVTRASAVIPVVPLYISLLYKVMKDKGIHENCIHQIYRLFSDRLYRNGGVGEVPVDEAGRIRMDDLEMRDEVQAEVERLWKLVGKEDLEHIADLQGYRDTFLEFHGFGVDGVDYEKDVEP